MPNQELGKRLEELERFRPIVLHREAGAGVDAGMAEVGAPEGRYVLLADVRRALQDVGGGAGADGVGGVGRVVVELTPEEARELFSCYLAGGLHPPEIDPSHPLVTGAEKLAAIQAPDQP